MIADCVRSMSQAEASVVSAGAATRKE